jgi:hypothetical protein
MVWLRLLMRRPLVLKAATSNSSVPVRAPSGEVVKAI